MQALTILAIAWLCILLAAKLWHDLRLWRNKEIKGTSTKTVNHPAEWLVLAIVASPAVYQLAMLLPLRWFFSLPLTGGMVGFIFWVLFDGLYNIRRRFGWFFTGSNDKDDAATDNFLQRFGVAGHVAKYICCGVLLFFYIKNLL